MLLVDFINVGYGDAILLREGAFTMLVDCGDMELGAGYSGSKRTGLAEFLRLEGIKRLQLVVITHLHKDHVGGLLALCDEVEIDELWTAYLPEETLLKKQVAISGAYSKGVNNLVLALNAYNRSLRLLLGKTRLRLMQKAQQETVLSPGFTVRVECAAREVYARQDTILNVLLRDGDVSALDELDEFINDSSLRLVLFYKGLILSLPGDITAESWLRQSPTRCDILKMPHHGHKDSMNEPLLNALSPAFTVLPVSNNRPDNCPSSEILQLLTANGRRYAFTDAVSLPGRAPVYRSSVRLAVDDTGAWSEQQI